MMYGRGGGGGGGGGGDIIEEMAYVTSAPVATRAAVVQEDQ